MNIASAALAAAPTLPVPPAAPAGKSVAALSFASQLLGLIPATPASPTQQAPTVNVLPVFALPKPLAKPATLSLPLSIGSKRSTPDQKQSAKAPAIDAATVAVTEIPPVPTAEIVKPSLADDVETIAVAAVAIQPSAAPPVETEEPEEIAAPSVSAAPAQPEPEEMAFAARVQPVQSTQHSALPAEMASSAAVASANKKVAAPPEDSSSATMAEPHAVPVATPNTAADRAAAPAAHAANAIHRTEAPVPPVEAATPKSTGPLKDISLQVNQPGKERVDVRVVQQGNEVHVSVHSGDATLTSGLRQGLSDLQSRLEETGYRSEMWRPGVSNAPVAAPPNAQESSNHSRGGEGQSQQHGGSQQEGGRRQQNQSNQPRWVEEMESSFGGEKTSGGFHGFSS